MSDFVHWNVSCVFLMNVIPNEYQLIARLNEIGKGYKISAQRSYVQERHCLVFIIFLPFPWSTSPREIPVDFVECIHTVDL